MALGFTRDAIDHRMAVGRLYAVARGVYVVGRPELTPHGQWMAAVLACGPGAMLSHGSAAALWGIGEEWREIEVTVRTASPRRRAGVRPLRTMLDRRTFRLTREQLERRFLPLAERVGLPLPLTKQWINGFEVDFYWPDLGFVIETDGLRYHRTPAEQARDRLRDQAHTAAGMTQLRFTHEQVYYEPEHVLSVLRPTARRLLAAA